MTNRSIIIQARMSSTRLPGKSLKLIGGKPLIFYVIERLRVLSLPIIVATSIDKSDDILVEYLKSLEDVLIYRGSLNNVLVRYINAADTFNVQEIIRITADNPFVDIEILKRCLTSFNDYDYIDGIYNDGLIKGSGFELVRLKELKAIESRNPYHLEHVTAALRENSSKNLKYKKVQVPSYHEFIDNIVLTCDYAEDLELLTLIFETFNYNCTITIHKIIELYRKKPELFLRNALLHH